jgi:hypothetical protein
MQEVGTVKCINQQVLPEPKQNSFSSFKPYESQLVVSTFWTDLYTASPSLPLTVPQYCTASVNITVLTSASLH